MSNSIIVKYQEVEYLKKEYEMQIEDSHYCFLEGQNKDYNITEFLGEYPLENEEYPKMINKQQFEKTIRIKSYACKGIYTDCTFKHFLESHNNVQEICEDKFKEELNKMLEKLK